MPSLISRITRFARSPKGRQLTERAQRYASSPEGKRKIEQVRSRTGRRR
jgi:hypothetical protein